MNSQMIAETCIDEQDALLTPAQRRVLDLLFPDTDPRLWHDWRWQLRHRIKTKEALRRLLSLTPDEEKGIAGAHLTMSIPPYFAALMDPQDPRCPIRRQSIPLSHEFHIAPEERRDPCGEEEDSPVKGLVHRYPDRVLFLVNEMCAMYCRYCTRSRMVGDGQRSLNRRTYEEALAYIRATPSIRDVLISGGDPLTLADGVLEFLLRELRSIPHVEFVRIGTRVPVTLPQRVTPELTAMLRRFHPLWMSLHFNHPKEITPAVARACGRLADAGIPLGSQTVLLKGINDDPEVMKALMHGLLKIRVRPYYIYQCDPVAGSKHFRTPVETGLRIIEHLRGHTTGYAVPTFVIDAPGGGGKIPLSPQYVVRRTGRKWTLRNYNNEIYEYIEP